MSLVLLLSASAWACSLMADEPFVVEPDPGDTEAPLEPVLVEQEIRRGRGPEPAGCGSTMATSCDDIGFITLTFAQPDGDAHEAHAIGYAIRFMGGDLPRGLEPPGGIWVGPTLTLTWIDDATDDQEPFEFAIGVSAVDAAGNESPDLFLDLHDGYVDGEHAPRLCGTVTGGATGWPLLLLGWAARRRRAIGRGER